jgi:KTSC domain
MEMGELNSALIQQGGYSGREAEMRSSCAILLCWLLAVAAARCETAGVEGAPPPGLEPLECVEVTRSRVIRRICYDELRQYMVVEFEGRHYRFCQVERETAEAFLQAKSLSQFFSQMRRRHPCLDGTGPQ